MSKESLVPLTIPIVVKFLVVASLILLASCQKESDESITIQGRLVKNNQDVSVFFRAEDAHLVEHMNEGDTIIASHSSGYLYLYSPEATYTTDTTIFITSTINYWLTYKQIIISNK